MTKFDVVVLSVIACVPAILSACPAHAQSSVPRPQLETEENVNTMRMLVDSFTILEGRRPTSLEEACLRLRQPYGGHLSPGCVYWVGDSIPLDGWRNPLRYEIAGTGVRILSAGADGIFGTPDDMGFDFEQERKRVITAAACYHVNFRGWDKFPGQLMRLDTVYVGGGFYQAAPVTEHYSTDWMPSPYPFGRDSVFLIWQALEHGAHFHFRVYPDSLAGSAIGEYRRRHVVITRMPCPS